MRPAIVATFVVCAAALSACSGGTPAPAGWQAAGSSQNQWSRGSGTAVQRYSYEKKSYPGTLQDLASQEAVNVALRYKGAKFAHSDIFPACPARAAIVTFNLGPRILQEAFAVANGNSVTVTYDRPASAPTDPAVASAMEQTLCGSVL